MKAIIDHLDHITQLHGSPVAKEALSAQVIREQNLNVNFQSLVEVLRSHRFENQISHRDLKDIPSLSTPVLLVLQNEEAAIVTKIEGAGKDRIYHLYQNGITHSVSADSLTQNYLGYCWFIKPQTGKDQRSELPEYHMPKAWFWKVVWCFRSYYYQVILVTFIINFLALVSSLYVMNVYDRVIPNKKYETL
ncbi:hypothetical protein HMPREF0027_1806 [Actinobacillus ureae ATCC 25976]|uniref:Peptidase C39 domain-containing protein n=1 Tax=Actinobacillus ureae ATCC 25976 TaxID=887324 RepID=E8KIY9_9PAST|nr:hypothetical protein HMPREF0027_1806 [Actinobacillus ureae ATCC 25976]